MKVVLTLTLVNANSACAPLSGYAIYLWHCDASDDYSLYTAASESCLRGVQVTDSNGQVTFTTIFPACYSGRYPHMHIEVLEPLGRDQRQERRSNDAARDAELNLLRRLQRPGCGSAARIRTGSGSRRRSW